MTDKHMKTEKKCSKCLIVLPAEAYTLHKGYLRPACRKCSYVLYTKPHKERNKKPRKERVVKEVKPKVAKVPTDPVTKKLAKNLRKRLKKQLDKGRTIGPTIAMLGCTVGEFRDYIEAQFSGEMTWDNYGKVWHLDHIKPVCSFNLRLEGIAKEVNHYKNLRPLLAEDNLKKSKEDVTLKYKT
jgi:hypothetical protein